MIGDTTIDALRVGLNGLNLRRQASEDAVANMDESGDPASAAPTITKTTDAALPNGNNVQVDQELMGLSDTELRQQLLVEAVNSKFRLLRTVIAG